MDHISVKKANDKIAQGVTSGYQKIEHGVVNGYKAMETGVVDGFTRVSDWFVGYLFTREGETVEQAKQRMAAQAAALQTGERPHDAGEKPDQDK